MTKERISALQKDHATCCPALRAALEAAQGECERLRQRLEQIQTRAEADWKIHAETSAELTRLRAENEALRAFRDALTDEEWRLVATLVHAEHNENLLRRIFDEISEEDYQKKLESLDALRAKLAKALEASPPQRTE